MDIKENFIYKWFCKDVNKFSLDILSREQITDQMNGGGAYDT